MKDVANPPIIPIASEPVKDDSTKGGVDAKKGKTEPKKKVSSTAKVDVVKAGTEVKVAEVATVETKVESSCPVKEVSVPSAAKVEVKVPETPPVIASIPSMKSAEVSAPCVQPAPVPEAVDEDEVVILKETISKKFGEMTFSDYISAEDGDFSLSEADTEDSLEWASETERTRAEDDLAEDKVTSPDARCGLNYD